MQAISTERSRLAQTALVSVLTFAALAMLGLVLAYWTWVWLAPRAEPRAPAVVGPTAGVVAALGLFGQPSAGGGVAAPSGLAIRLLGIVAAPNGGSGYAAVQLQAKDIVAVREGEDIAAGIRLVEVGTHHVILERGGVRETLALPLPRSAPATAPAAPVVPIPQPVQPGQ
jgi:general secretion pathway protein C